MKDYTPVSGIFRVQDWAHVPVQDEWLHPNHVFGLRNPLIQEIKDWLEQNIKAHYAFLSDEDYNVNHVLAFSRDSDAAFFLLRWL